MANSAKNKAYERDISRYFRKANKAGDLYPTYSGYTPWSDGYKAGYAAGKAKGIQQTGDKFRD